MKISARNAFPGTITAVRDGAVNAEIELSLSHGDKLVAIVTEGSAQSLGLAVGQSATAFVKAPWVVLLEPNSGLKFSARNHLHGEVVQVSNGAVNSEVSVKLRSGTLVYAVVTNDAVQDMGLKVGVPIDVLIKASHILIGVPA